MRLSRQEIIFLRLVVILLAAQAFPKTLTTFQSLLLTRHRLQLQPQLNHPQKLQLPHPHQPSLQLLHQLRPNQRIKLTNQKTKITRRFPVSKSISTIFTLTTLMTKFLNSATLVFVTMPKRFPVDLASTPSNFQNPVFRTGLSYKLLFKTPLSKLLLY